MTKKIVWALCIIAFCCIIALYVLTSFNNKKEQSINQNEATNSNNETTPENDNNMVNNSKILVVYYSATGSTKRVAENIASNLHADEFVIEPVSEYTSSDLDWTNNESRVSKEHNDESLRNVKLKNTSVPNWENYDTILIGFPVWWNLPAWVVNNFVKENDFTGKTVIPFCTSASSSIDNSTKVLKEMASTGNWQEGQRFSSNASDEDILKFTNTIK